MIVSMRLFSGGAFTGEVLSIIVVGVVAFAVAALTLFSGFGLGSILVATFVVFFPVEVAVSAAAVVHLAYNMLKTALLHRESVPRILVRFGVPAVAASFIGALMLARLAGQSPVFTWQAGGLEAVVTPLKFLMGALIVGFAVFDLVPRLHSVRFGSRWLPVGGALSGFFGGLSGHQGAFRAAFLSRLGLEPAAYVGTQAVLAIMVDASRLLVYGAAVYTGHMAMVSTPAQWRLVGVAAICAFGGVFLGWRLLRRATVPVVRLIVGYLLLLVGLGLATGIF
jgi:uncharacterized membrane protein YfcA